MTQYTTFTITEQGLLIQLTDEGKEYAKEILETYKECIGIKEAFPGMPRHLWEELNEVNFCNGYCNVPDQHKGLTEAPMISDSIIDEETTQLEIDSCNIWAFTDYMVKDELEILLTTGQVLFPRVQSGSPLPQTYRDIKEEHVTSYAEREGLNIDTPENYREAAQALFNRVHGINLEDDTNAWAEHLEGENQRLKDQILDMEQVISELNHQLSIKQPPDIEDKPIGIMDIQLCINAKNNKESLELNGIPAVGVNCMAVESLVKKLYASELWSYEDKSVNLKEHLFGLSLYDDFQENRIIVTKEEEDSLDAIYQQMSEKDCSYFRFIS
jgi:hypothetical protein